MSIEERLARLERGNRFWKRFAVVLLAALGAVLLIGQRGHDKPKWLEVRSLKLVDDEGDFKATLDTLEDTTSLSFNSRAGPGLLGLSILEGDKPAVALRSADLSANAMLFISEEGPLLALRGAPKSPYLHVGVKNGRQPYVALHTENGTTRARLELSREGDPSLKMYDAKGNVIWQAPR